MADGALGAAHVPAGEECTLADPRDAGLIAAGAGPLAEAATAVVIPASCADALRNAGSALAGVADLPQSAAGVAAGQMVAGADKGPVAARVRTASPAVQGTAAAVRWRAALGPQAGAGLGCATRAQVAGLPDVAAGAAALQVGALAGPIDSTDLQGGAGPAVQGTAAAVGRRAAVRAQTVAGRQVAAEAPIAALTGSAAKVPAGDVVADAEAVEAGRLRVVTGAEAEAAAAVVVPARGPDAVRDAGGAAPALADLPRGAADPDALGELALTGALDAGLVRACAEAGAHTAAAVVVAAGRAGAGRRAAHAGDTGLARRAARTAADHVGALALESV